MHFISFYFSVPAMFLQTPLKVYNVNQNQQYLFRVINPGALYGFRVSVDHHKLHMVATDGYDFEPYEVESFLINPGERFDFTLTADQESGINYYIRAIIIAVRSKTQHTTLFQHPNNVVST